MLGSSCSRDLVVRSLFIGGEVLAAVASLDLVAGPPRVVVESVCLDFLASRGRFLPGADTGTVASPPFSGTAYGCPIRWVSMAESLAIFRFSGTRTSSIHKGEGIPAGI